MVGVVVLEYVYVVWSLKKSIIDLVFQIFLVYLWYVWGLNT
jgi:hypothetical protein